MLREPIAVQPASEVGPVHFIAIGGAGMSGIAQLYHDLGVEVSGSDQADSPSLRQLAHQGIRTHVGHDAAQLGDARTVVVSSAIREDNPELMAARERGLRIWHRSAALAALMLGREAVAIAGTHGKTTTTGMTSVMLTEVGADPSYVIGSPLASTGKSAHLGGGAAFVVEADESDGTFLQYPTTIAVITNVEADHLDNWGTAENYHAGFTRFATGEHVRAVVLDGDDPVAATLGEQLRADGLTVLAYGERPGCEVQLSELDFEGTSASATITHDGWSGRLELQVPGRYNLGNAAAAFAVGRLLGHDPDALARAAGTFTGTLRRFQLVGEVDGVRVFDDYAHHPTEIRAALTAARKAVGDGRLVACFQPHLFSRTRDFADEFGQALALADLVVLTDIYAAREDPMAGVDGSLVLNAALAAGADALYVPNKAHLPSALAELVRPGDLVMTLGAGDVTLVGPLLVDLLHARPAADEGA
ncbi:MULTISPECIES: UDP-N-acetylmuramate--L-alanine ligase [unclassified Luteococcus]|uniref:UDP-N-acetylmuramate--L-alanine ligase n=1 Tax=unclassified Luteococcus TaxID=2639923 RepID=UPI00313CBDBA